MSRVKWRRSDEEQREKNRQRAREYWRKQSQKQKENELLKRRDSERRNR